MPTYHASLPFRRDQEAGIRETAVLTDRYDSFRHDNSVALPTRRDDLARAAHEALTARFESVRADILVDVAGRYDIDYSSGNAVALRQEFDVVQNYLQGHESIAFRLDSFFSSGKAGCLAQGWDVIQSYLQGSESILSAFETFFAVGKAVCLSQCFDVDQSFLRGDESIPFALDSFFSSGKTVCLNQRFEIVQSYLQGSEAWPGICASFYSSGRAHCLDQAYDIDQPYLRGDESWPNAYESFFSSGRSTALFQTFDVFQPYVRGGEFWFAVFDVVDGALRVGEVLGQTYETVQRDFMLTVLDRYESAAIQVFETAGMFDRVADGFSTPVIVLAARYDTLAHQNALAGTLFDAIRPIPVWESRFSWDRLRYYERLLQAATTVVVLDTHSGKPREVDYPSTFGKKTISRVAWIGLHRCPETVSQTVAAMYDIARPGNAIIRLQEEALYEYAATLVNVVTSMEVANGSPALRDITGPLRPFCTGDSLWEIEVATRVRYHDPARPAAFKNPVVWRFVTKDGKHWKQGPVVSDLHVETLDSFFQLRFSAVRPYGSIGALIDTWQLEIPEDGDFFDLGVWVSDSVEIDTEASPVLLLSYSDAIKEYAVHVPRTDSVKFIGVAPIRKFPYEEVGALAEIVVP